MATATVDHRKLLMDEQARNVHDMTDAAIVVMALNREYKTANGLQGLGGNRDDHPIFAAATEVMIKYHLDGAIHKDDRPVWHQARARVIKYARQAFTGPYGGQMDSMIPAFTTSGPSDRQDTMLKLLQEYRSVVHSRGSAATLERELKEAMGYGAW